MTDKNLCIFFIAGILFMTFPKIIVAQDDLSWDIRHPTDTINPALLITSRKDVSEAVIQLTRMGSDGARQDIVLRPHIRTGRQNVVELPKHQGRSTWRGTIRITFADGSEGQAPLFFETAWADAFEIRGDATRDDVLARRVVMYANHPVERAVVKVYGEGGRLLGESSSDLGAGPPDTPLHIRWEQQVEGEPILIKATLYSVHGVHRSMRWRPWQVNIPHETVVFETGKSEIREDQVPKLTSVLDELNAARNKYGSIVEVNLWIAGHTDTVGPREFNLNLSNARARAIAAWFRQAGVDFPIYYRGFGQESLKVRTADNVDEPKNRRAEYIVSSEDPYAGRRLPGRWRRLE